MLQPPYQPALVIGGFRRSCIFTRFRWKFTWHRVSNAIDYAYACNAKQLAGNCRSWMMIQLSCPQVPHRHARKAHQVPVVLKGPPAPPPPGLEHLMKKDPNTKTDENRFCEDIGT